MQIVVFGAGLVGRRVATSLRDRGHDIVLVAHQRNVLPIEGVQTATGWPNPAEEDADIVVLATESAHQYVVARQLVRAGKSVVTTADDPAQVRRLWALDDLARDRGALLIVGAAYSPGISTLLANYLVRGFDEVSTISTAQFGTGGPACAREHHRAMSSSAYEVHGGLLRPTRGGSGRELVWFPDPVGAADCYRAALSDPFLLHQAFPAIERIESRQAATRRDRLTARLPMLRPPHAEGLLGAVWAEVRGRIDGRVEHRVMAASAAQATGAAAMVAAFCQVITTAKDQGSAGVVNVGSRDKGGVSPVGGGVTPSQKAVAVGSQSAATWKNPVSLLRLVSNDVRLFAYDGSEIVTNSGIPGPIQAARKWSIPGETPGNTTFSSR